MIQNPVTKCTLCPRQCGINRSEGVSGYCKAGNIPVLYTYSAHHGEEPPVSGKYGSGTVFFSHCTMRCIYCQNYPWSQLHKGIKTSSKELAEIFCNLAEQQCHNINLVTPTPWLPWICEAGQIFREKGWNIPFVYNTSGYERIEILQELQGFVQIYLTDLRYASDKTAYEASHTHNYVNTARKALLEMAKQTGKMKFDNNGIAISGTICRILVLPGHSKEAIDNLNWISENLGNDVAVSLMAQYVPAYQAVQKPWNRRLFQSEYNLVKDEMEMLNFEIGWIQELDETTDEKLIGYKMPETII